ncbi:MAG TPA: TIGR02679 family protein [Streptosporangiaceae bacterium]|jgi:uncharacterized protein (TIGR02679 family)|nr:TIGR02679 family protein [Streptosporangiaceae bacterium]
MTVDHAKLLRMLGTPELAWLVSRIRARLERGEPVDGTVTLVGATAAQRRAAARLLGRDPGRGTSLSVPLPEVAEQIWRAAAAPNLVAAVEAIGGPVRNLAAERAADLQRWGDALTEVRSSPLSQSSWYREWLSSISRDGTITRLIRQGHADVIGQATAVLERLADPSEEGCATLPALASAATGNDRALAEGPLAGLVLRALAAREGVQAPASRDAEQALWTAAGIVADDLASQVLVLNVRAAGDPVGRWLTEAADAGEPFRLTLRQLIAAPVLPWALEIYVCASSALVRAAADELGRRCPALVCTEGQPSVACTRLLKSAVSSGSTVNWHADFSWPGLRGTAIAVRHLQARPWLMAASDYEAVLSGGVPDSAVPLSGRPESSPWDPRLAEVMRLTGRGMGEELVMPGLLAALTARADEFTVH